MSRLSSVWQRYGWRTPYVVISVLAARCGWFRGKLVVLWLRLTTKGTKGSNIKIGRQVSVSPGADLSLGDNLYIGARCIFEVSVNPMGSVRVGSNTWITHDCHISSYGSIDIGEDVLIGEFVSLRDSSHAYSDHAKTIKGQQDVLGRIIIEDGVWIGRGCLIQGKPEGTVIGRGAIIAANSVVSRSIPAMEVWGGTPVRFIKCR